MIEEIKFPFIADRFIGTSLPKDNKIILISYEGTHIINLINSEITTDYKLQEGGIKYNSEKQTIYLFKQFYKIHGLYGMNPIHTDSKKNKLVNDKKNEKIKMITQNLKELLIFEYEDLSGDWSFLSFSNDFNYIIFLLPYEFHLFRTRNWT